MSTVRRLATFAATLAATLAVAPAASAHDLTGLRAVGLAGGGTELVVFRTDAPQRARSLGPLAGLDGDTSLVGIDYRPATGVLYGVGDEGGIYVVDDRTGDTARVGRLTEALHGDAFGVDVDPVADALHVVSDDGQNIAQGIGADGAPDGRTVAYADLNRSGAFTLTPASGVVALAYIDDDADPATGSTACVVDTRDDRLGVLFPQEKGTVRGVGDQGTLTALTGDAGADVYSRGGDPDERDDDLYVVAAMGSEYRLLAVKLADGTFADRGAFPSDVLDLAVDPLQ